MSGVHAKLQGVFKEVFSDNDLEVSRETTAQDILSWDSLMHVTLIVNVEQAFNVRFSSRQVASLANVGEWIDIIEAKLAE